MMETTIYNFHTSFYIPAIQKLAFHIPHIQILGTNHCGDSFRTKFKCHKSFQDVLFHRYYYERVDDSFPPKIQPESYCGNRFMSIEGILLENLSELSLTEIKASTESYPRHALFHYFLSDDSKQDTTTTTAHIKFLIELLQEQKLLTSTLRTIWENTDGCADQYICASEPYLISFLPQCH